MLPNKFNRKKLIQFFFYCLCGAISASIAYIIYYIAITIGFWYGIANAISYLLGTVISFFLNRKITFQTKDNTLYRLLSFLCVAFIGFVTSTLLLWFLIDHCHLDPRITKLMILPIEAIIQFSLNYSITFKKLVYI